MPVGIEEMLVRLDKRRMIQLARRALGSHRTDVWHSW
jgi:hypothetical protein